MYKIRIFEIDALAEYEFATYEEADSWCKERLERFIKNNAVRDQSTDKAFLNFKESLYQFLEKKMDDYLQCKVCHPMYHCDQFCRCEIRNIRVAKEQRARGESAWQKTDEVKK